MVVGLLKKLGTVRQAMGLALYSRTEIKLTERCIAEVEKKRKRALKRLEQRTRAVNKHGAKTISGWEADDSYADDAFYNQKCAECYERNRPVSRAMGMP